MRTATLISISVTLLACSLHAQTAEQSLRWTRENIDAHAVTHHLEPPARVSGVKWQVNKIKGCTVELLETDHRESSDSVVKRDGVYSLNEDKTITWTFDLGSLLPQFVMADTSAGLPHIKIFAEGDAFHTKTETVSRAVRSDGSVESTSTWSAAANARNLMMYFDSPEIDNKALVHRLESDLRDAVYGCMPHAAK
jgi:hypothetical protein